MPRLLPVLLLVTTPAWGQSSPPLQPYAPPPSAAPLAPLAGAPEVPEPPLGDVRLNSNDASNISAADTRSPIAPRLPDPASAGDSMDALLRAARQAIEAHQTGAAQEALERAESRALTRDIAPSDAQTPVSGPIAAARQALSVGNEAAALAAITQALQHPPS